MQLSRYEFYVPFIKNRKKKSNKSTSYKFILSAQSVRVIVNIYVYNLDKNAS